MIPRKRWAYVIPVAVVMYMPAYLDRTNALGNLGGFAGPYLVGWLTDVTGSTTTGFVVLAAFLAVAAALAFSGLKPAAVEGLAHVPAATRNP